LEVLVGSLPCAEANTDEIREWVEAFPELEKDRIDLDTPCVEVYPERTQTLGGPPWYPRGISR
jgi:hypothetical protein